MRSGGLLSRPAAVIGGNGLRRFAPWRWSGSRQARVPVAAMQRKDVIRAPDANADTVRFANYIVQVVRMLFEHAIDLGWRDDNPAKGVSLIKSAAAPREAWPKEMIAA